MDEFFAAIEELEMEKQNYINSKEYRIGNKFLLYMNCLKKMQFQKIWKYESIRKKNKIVQKKYYDFQPTIINKTSNTTFNSSNKKIVIYTCITGKYDCPKKPLIHEKNVSYFFLTDNDEFSSEGWNKRIINQKILNQINDSKLINRYVKMHPKEFFPDYDIAIYLDGSVKPISNVSSFANFINSTTGLAIHQHYCRNSLYSEVKACSLYGKGNFDKMKSTIDKYINEGLPYNFGILECTVIVSDLNNSTSIKILDEWWREFLISGCGRDQLVLPYILWKNNYTINDVGSLGTNIHRNYKINFSVSHKS